MMNDDGHSHIFHGLFIVDTRMYIYMIYVYIHMCIYIYVYICMYIICEYELYIDFTWLICIYRAYHPPSLVEFLGTAAVR